MVAQGANIEGASNTASKEAETDEVMPIGEDIEAVEATPEEGIS